MIVNSETFPWLHTGSGAKQKPDLFTCPKWVYKARNLDTPSSIQRYGGVSDRRLYSMTPFTCWTAKRSSLLLLLASSLFTCSISTRPKTLKYLGECSLGKPSSGLPLYRDGVLLSNEGEVERPWCRCRHQELLCGTSVGQCC